MPSDAWRTSALSISIAIINWNSWDLLEKCLEHLLNQTYQAFNIRIIDNCSAERVPPRILEYGPRVSIIRNSRNLGFACANNQIFASLSKGDFIVLLNPDAFPKPDWLENLIKAAKLFPMYSAYSSRLISAQNPETLDGDGDVYHISGLAWRERRIRCTPQCNCQPSEMFSACAAAAMYRIDDIKRVGGFDDDFFCYMEDVDLGFRLRLAGCKTLLVPNAVAAHIGSATTGGQKSDFTVYHGHRNLVWTYVKNMPGFTFWLFLPLHLVINLVTVMWFCFQGQGQTILRAKRDALRRLPQMWRKRKRIQRRRVASVADILRAMDKSLIPLKRFTSAP